jgi:hypothetical protein
MNINDASRLSGLRTQHGSVLLEPISTPARWGACVFQFCAAARHVLEVLEPLSVEHGGPLLLQHMSYVEGRGNIIVEYPGEPGGGVISFVGAHMVREWVWLHTVVCGCCCC